jgi:acyl carrier protein
MNRQEFFNELEEIIEADKGSLTGSEVLKELEGWDSVAVMGFIAMVDNSLGITLDGDKIINCKTVNDLFVLVNDEKGD